jgi:hypothetical protein
MSTSGHLPTYVLPNPLPKPAPDTLEDVLSTGNDGGPHDMILDQNLVVAGEIQTGIQKACAGGQGLSIPATQTLLAGVTATLIVNNIMFDYATPMFSGNSIVLNQPSQVWLIAAMVWGTYAGPAGGNQTISLYIRWVDGNGVTRTIGRGDFPALRTGGTSSFSCYVGGGMKTNIGPNTQSIYAELFNDTSKTLTLVGYRFSAARLA